MNQHKKVAPKFMKILAQPFFIRDNLQRENVNESVNRFV